jgi:integrase
MRQKLTEPFLKNGWKKHQPKTGRIIVWDADFKKFGLQIMASGFRRFVVQYRTIEATGARGRTQRQALGGSIDIAGRDQARAEAQSILGRLSGAKATRQGYDPLADRRAEDTRKRAAIMAKSDTLTVRMLLNAYMRSKPFREQRRHENVAAGIQKQIMPRLGDKAALIGDKTVLTRHDITACVDDIAEKVGPGAAIAAFSRLRAALNWYASAKQTEIVDLPGDNAAFVVPIVKGMAPPKGKPRERTLSDDEIRKLWGAANGVGQFGRLVKFLLLTALRRDEARLMPKAELSDNQVEIPAERYKTGKTFVAPLSPQAKAILGEIPAHEWDLVFAGPNGKALDHSRLKRDLDAAAGVTGYGLHDLRRSARSIMSKIPGITADTKERCLGHAIGGIRGVYDKHDYYVEKKAAFEALANEIDRIINGNVVRLGAAA